MKAAELFDVTGRVAFITGAASGLGLAMAEVLARNGASVVMADLNRASLIAKPPRCPAPGPRGKGRSRASATPTGLRPPANGRGNGHAGPVRVSPTPGSARAPGSA